MFTGIIEALGVVQQVRTEGSNRVFEIASSLSHELTIDQSVSHNGVCLTITGVKGNMHTVVAVDETLTRSTLKHISAGDSINLERAMRLGERLDGHLVQGHVDTMLQCRAIDDINGSHIISLDFAKSWAPLLIPKGSVCLNGISLTIAALDDEQFKVAIIPYTWEHTNLHMLRPGDFLNVEFDMVGKYLKRFHDLEA